MVPSAYSLRLIVKNSGIRQSRVKDAARPALAGATAHCEIPPMRTILILAALACATPAVAQNYPVSGKWGESTSSEKGAIDCSGKRVIGFNGDQRTDSKGGVPAYRNRSVTTSGSSYRVVDEFTTGQISNGHTTYNLRKIDDDHVEMTQQGGSTLKLRRCK
jgi:hypothetical protein